MLKFIYNKKQRKKLQVSYKKTTKGKYLVRILAQQVENTLVDNNCCYQL